MKFFLVTDLFIDFSYRPNKEDVTNDEVIQWPTFVHLCLTNNPPEQFIDQYDGTTGPTTANLREIIIGNKPRIKIHDGRIVFQVAITSTTLKHTLMNMRCLIRIRI